MFGDRKVDGLAAVVRQDHEDKQELEKVVGTTKKSAASTFFMWFRGNARHT
jgi:hypothetical protein